MLPIKFVFILLLTCSLPTQTLAGSQKGKCATGDPLCYESAECGLNEPYCLENDELKISKTPMNATIQKKELKTNFGQNKKISQDTKLHPLKTPRKVLTEDYSYSEKEDKTGKWSAEVKMKEEHLNADTALGAAIRRPLNQNIDAGCATKLVEAIRSDLPIEDIKIKYAETLKSCNQCLNRSEINFHLHCVFRNGLPSNPEELFSGKYGCSQAEIKTATRSGIIKGSFFNQATGKCEGSQNVDKSSPGKVDFVFMVDNSGSMGPTDRTIILNSIPRLSNAIQRLRLDSNIILTTQNFNDPDQKAPVPINEASGLTDGVAVFHADSPNLKAQVEVAINSIVGVYGDGYEREAEALHNNVMKRGLVRQGSSVIVLAITDEVDQSPQNAEFYLNNIGRAKKITWNSTYYVTDPSQHGDPSQSSLLLDLTKKTGGLYMPLNEDLVVQQIEKILEEGSKQVIHLEKIADPDSIEVILNEKTILNSQYYEFDRGSNSVILKLPQEFNPRNMTIEVHYAGTEVAPNIAPPVRSISQEELAKAMEETQVLRTGRKSRKASKREATKKATKTIISQPKNNNIPKTNKNSLPQKTIKNTVTAESLGESIPNFSKEDRKAIIGIGLDTSKQSLDFKDKTLKESIPTQNENQTQFIGARFDRSILMDINLSNKDLRSTSFLGAKLSDIDFSGASLEGARFNLSKINQFRFENSKIKGSFAGASLEQADFSGAQIGAISFSKANLRNAEFIGARLSNIELNDTNATEAQFKNAVFFKSSFQRSNLDKSNFDSTEILNSTFANSSLRNSNFSKAYAKGVNFRGCDFTGSDLTGFLFDDTTIFTGATFDEKALKSSGISEQRAAKLGINQPLPPDEKQPRPIGTALAIAVQQAITQTSSALVQETTDSDIDSIITKNSFTIVELSMPGCEPCKKLKAILEVLSKKYKQCIKFVEYDVTRNNRFTSEYTPVLLFFKNGKKEFDLIGLNDPRNLEKIINDRFLDSTGILKCTATINSKTNSWSQSKNISETSGSVRKNVPTHAAPPMIQNGWSVR